MNLPPYEKRDNAQISVEYGFPLLDMSMSSYPYGDLKIVIFSSKRQQLKYTVNGSTHAPGTLHPISSGVLNRLSKFTSHKPGFRSNRLDSVYPNCANALRELVLAPSIFPTMGELWKENYEKWILTRGIIPLLTKKIMEMSIFTYRIHVISMCLCTG